MVSNPLYNGYESKVRVGKRLANDPRGGQETLRVGHAERGGDGRDGGGILFRAGRPGEGVGIAGIDDERPGAALAARQAIPAPGNVRRSGCRAREHTCAACFRGKSEQEDVIARHHGAIIEAA